MSSASPGAWVLPGARRPEPPFAPRRASTPPVVLLVAALCSLGVGVLLGVGTAPAVAPADPANPEILTCDGDGYRYSYQVVTGAETLYVLATDPSELHNVSASHPDVVKRLRRKLAARLRVDSLERLGGADDRTRELLRSLGYL